MDAVPVSIGVSFPESIVPGAPLPDIAGLAGLAEQAGLDGVWASDQPPGPALSPRLAATRSASCRRRRCRRCGSAGLPSRRCGAPSGPATAGCPDCRHRASSPPAASNLFELSDQAGRPRPRTGIGLHAAIGTGTGRDLAEVTAGNLQAMFGVPADRAREVAIAGTPAQVASRLAPYVAAGADLIVVVCDPAPSPRSWELLAEVRLLLTR